MISNSIKLSFFVVLTTTGCSTLGAKKVLILGKSVVSVNDLPEIISNITQSMGKNLILESSTDEQRNKLRT